MTTFSLNEKATSAPLTPTPTPPAQNQGIKAENRQL